MQATSAIAVEETAKSLRVLEILWPRFELQPNSNERSSNQETQRIQDGPYLGQSLKGPGDHRVKCECSLFGERLERCQTSTDVTLEY